MYEEYYQKKKIAEEFEQLTFMEMKGWEYRPLQELKNVLEFQKMIMSKEYIENY